MWSYFDTLLGYYDRKEFAWVFESVNTMYVGGFGHMGHCAKKFTANTGFGCELECGEPYYHYLNVSNHSELTVLFIWWQFVLNNSSHVKNRQTLHPSHTLLTWWDMMRHGWDWPECTTTRTANLLKCSLEHSLWLAGLCWTGFIEKFIHSFTEKSTQRWNKMGYDMKALYHIRLNLLVESLILRIMFHSILVNHRKHWKFELIHKPRFQFTNRLLIDVNIL